MKKSVFTIALVMALPLAAAKLSFPEAGDADDFAAWQGWARPMLGQILYNGAPPEAVPLEPEYGEPQQRQGYNLVEVNFQDRPGHMTYGVLARPTKPKAKKLPAVVSLHGHGGTAIQTFDPDEMYYYGDLLARKGYVVLALDIDHKYLDHDRPFKGYSRLPRNVEFPAMGQRVWMVKRGVDLLASLPDVDPQSIGIVGLSNGGLTTMFAAAMDERLKMVVASGSLIMHDRMWHRELLHCRCQYLDKMDGVLDYYDVFALVAPRALVVQNGKKDPIFPIGSAGKAFEHIKRAYALAGAPDNVYHDVHEGAHAFRSEVPLQWFEKHLPLEGG